MMRTFSRFGRIASCGLLFAATVFSSPSGTFAADANAAEGCVNQWMFNGVWRVQITGVEPLMDGPRQSGWQVTEVWRNGSQQQLAPNDSYPLPQQLELGARTIQANPYSQQALGVSLAPSGQTTQKLQFTDPNIDPADKPKAVQIAFDAAKNAANKAHLPQLTTSRYNYRIKLDCTATGAAPAAQGGSKQVDAREGCLNQWLSNGIWKVRVTAVTPKLFDPNNPQSEQTAWVVTQDWVNVTQRSANPSAFDAGLSVPGTQAKDEFVITQSGNNYSSANGVNVTQPRDLHTFPPGGSFTFSPAIGGGKIDPSDKAVRVLITFDAKRENSLANHPRYQMPANFRISLECSK